MTALCPMDRGPGRPWFHADRSAARMITPQEATAAVQSLWDAATDLSPGALDECAALEASTRLAAIHAAHRARAGRAIPPRHRMDLIRHAANLLDAADEFQSVAVHL